MENPCIYYIYITIGAEMSTSEDYWGQHHEHVQGQKDWAGMSRAEMSAGRLTLEGGSMMSGSNIYLLSNEPPTTVS